jgi:hypothetical protein
MVAFFGTKPVDSVAKAVYFVIAHAQKRRNKLVLWPHTVGRGKTTLICGCTRWAEAKQTGYVAKPLWFEANQIGFTAKPMAFLA